MKNDTVKYDFSFSTDIFGYEIVKYKVFYSARGVLSLTVTDNKQPQVEISKKFYKLNHRTF